MNAVAIIAPYIDIGKQHVFMNCFFKSQFNYYHLIWIWHSFTNTRKINRFHQRYSKIIYTDKLSSFMKSLMSCENCQFWLLKCTKSVKIFRHPLCTMFSNYVVKKHIILRLFLQLFTQRLNSVFRGYKSVSFLEPKLRDLLPNKLKIKSNLAAFKKAIKQWSLEKYPGSLSKIYVSSVFFV